jgi:hypothetical protein
MAKRSSDLKQLTKTANAAGWTCKDTKKGQMWLAPNGIGKVLIHTSGGSDHRGFKNALAAFRRAGLDI